MVKLPKIVKDVIVDVITCERVVLLVVGVFVAEPPAIFPHDKVPAPARVQAAFPFARLLSVTVPDTVSVNEELTVNVALAPVKVIFVHAAAAVTVTVWLFCMLTLSPAIGIVPPDQVEVEFQLPELIEEIWAVRG